MSQPHLSRIFVAVDLSVKAIYSDNSLFLLASSGSTFTSVDPHGNSTTQLVLYAIKRYKAKLLEVVKFRNLHVEPTLTLPHLESGTYQLGYRLSSVKWPCTIEAAKLGSQLRFQTDGSVSLDSEDATARVVLHPNAHRVAVCFPLLTASADTTLHRYIWQTQLYAMDKAPQRWCWPLHLLQQASAEHDTQQRQEPQQQQQQQQQQQSSVVSQQAPLSLQSITHLPVAVTPDTVLSAFPKQSWWFDCSHSLPHDMVILLEWTPDALYQYSPDTLEAAAWIHADQSCLLSEGQGRFLRHCKGRQQAERLYAAEATPVHSSSADSARYPLAEFAQHALHLRYNACATAVPPCNLVNCVLSCMS